MLEVKQNDIENNIENINIEDKTWRSCCLIVDKNMTVYLSQMTFAMLILLFSCFQLIKYSDKCEVSSPYFSLISFLMGKLLSNILTTK